MRARLAVSGLAFALVFALVFSLAPAAGAAPYDADPLGLVPFQDTVQEIYTSGTDTWEVWICSVPGWNPVVEMSSLVSRLNSTLTPYFDWLSGGAYTASFVAGGTVSSDDQISPEETAPEEVFAPGCEQEVQAASASGPNGALIVVDAGFDQGYATAGAVCPEAPFSGCQTTYPDNARRVVVGAATVATVAPFSEPQWITIAHEIGHALNWAHSFSGLNTLPGGDVSRYDNPMDVMSGAAITGAPVGTIAYNRYAAGWITPSQVAIHTDGNDTYQLSSIGNGGTQMLVIPSGVQGLFHTLGTRRLSSYDAKLPKAGVEIYEVDQRREVACTLPSGLPQTWPCFATFVEINQQPGTTGDNGTLHVLGIDESLLVGPFTVQVVSASTTGFSVRVTERESGRFVDDDGSPHEADIETLATLGITLGCNPPDNDRFCPTQPVTRAEMAVFLIRALGEEANLGAHEGYFPDVPEGTWYSAHVERLFELGITTGNEDGTYTPSASVSRDEMSAFLNRAFGTLPPPSPTGVFADVPASAWYAGHAESIYQLGITNGCASSPLLYCPANDVLREQMASFIVRALG